jgi:hypothetical protein
MLEAALQSIRAGLSDPLTIVVGLLAGAVVGTWRRALVAGAVATVVLLGVDIATGLVHPGHIAWALVPANFVAPLVWASAGFVGKRWYDDGERAGVRLARGLLLGAVAGAVVGLAIGLAYVNLAATGAREGAASAATMLAALLTGALGAIIGMILAIGRPPSKS